MGPISTSIYVPHMGSPHGTRMGFANGIGMGPIWVFDMGPIINVTLSSEYNGLGLGHYYLL